MHILKIALITALYFLISVILACGGKKGKPAFKYQLPEQRAIFIVSKSHFNAKPVVACLQADGGYIFLPLFSSPDSLCDALSNKVDLNRKPDLTGELQGYFFSSDTFQKYIHIDIDSALIIACGGSYSTAHFKHFAGAMHNDGIFSLGAVYTVDDAVPFQYRSSCFALSAQLGPYIKNKEGPKKPIGWSDLPDTVRAMIDTVNCKKIADQAKSVIGGKEYVMVVITLQKRGDDTCNYFLSEIPFQNYQFLLINGVLSDFKSCDSAQQIYAECTSLPVQINGHPVFLTGITPPFSEGLNYECWCVRDDRLLNVGLIDKLTLDSLVP